MYSKIDHIALSVRDIEKSIIFYQMLGFVKFNEWKEDDLSIQMIMLKNNDNNFIELVYLKDNKTLPKHLIDFEDNLYYIGTKHIAFRVKSIEQTLDFLLKHDMIKKHSDITKGKLGRRYFFTYDPNDIVIEFIEDNIEITNNKMEANMREITKINPSSMKQPTKSYSNGIFIPRNADMLFVTGQVAQDTEGKVVAPYDMAEQTKFIFGQIGRILEDAGMTFDDVVKAQIFLTDMSKSSLVSTIRDDFFKNSKPASTMVEINKLVKPECVVEIEVIAAKL